MGPKQPDCFYFANAVNIRIHKAVLQYAFERSFEHAEEASTFQYLP